MTSGIGVANTNSKWNNEFSKLCEDTTTIISPIYFVTASEYEYDPALFASTA
jgi:hypothetical protein